MSCAKIKIKPHSFFFLVHAWPKGKGPAQEASIVRLMTTNVISLLVPPRSQGFGRSSSTIHLPLHHLPELDHWIEIVNMGKATRLVVRKMESTRQSTEGDMNISLDNSKARHEHQSGVLRYKKITESLRDGYFQTTQGSVQSDSTRW